MPLCPATLQQYDTAIDLAAARMEGARAVVDVLPITNPAYFAAYRKEKELEAAWQQVSAEKEAYALNPSGVFDAAAYERQRQVTGHLQAA